MEAIGKTPITVKARAMKQFILGKKDYLPKKETNADLDLIMKCALCPNMCRFDCPVSEAAKTETLSPAGKSRLALLFETGHLEAEKVKDILYNCCNCDSCKQWCPFDFSLGDLLIGVHQDLVEKEHIPDNVLKIKEELNDNHIIGENKFKKTSKKEQAEVLYFMGCSVRADQKEIAESMINIFEKIDEDYTFINDEWCCGAPLYKLGFKDEFKEYAEKNIKDLKKTGCKTLVCSCPTCADIIKNIYPEIGVNTDIEILHTSEYLKKITKDKKLNDVDKKCVYHDPCTLVRNLNITEEPREILNNIPKLKLKDPYFSKQNTQCCGRGGSLSKINEKLSETITKKRVQDLHRDSDVIITSCPTCKTAFEKQKSKVFDISEIVDMALKD